MDSLENQIKRKISIRKMAIEHMGIQEESGNITQAKNEDTEINKLYDLLKNNIKEADANSTQTWHWFLKGTKISVFIKKVLRKSAKTLYGWLMFPIMSRQSYFNGKTVNSINILKDIVSLQQQKIEQLNNELGQHHNELEQRIQNQINEIENRLQGQIRDTDRRVQDESDNYLKSVQNQSAELDHKIQYLQDQNTHLLQIRIDENNSETNNRFEKVDQNINRLRNSVNHFQRQIDPGLRFDVENKQSIIIDEINDMVLKEKVLQLAQAPEDEINDKLVEVTDYYGCKVQQEIENSMMKKRKLIIIFCLRFQSEYGLEAIKNEAYDLYQLLLRESIYDVKIVSLEKETVITEYSNSIVYVNKENLNECFEMLSPSLIILLESTPYSVFDTNGVLIKNHTLIKLTGQNPLQGLDSKTIEELRHCNDYGVNRYLVESKYACQVMEENGFRNVDISYPVIDKNRITILNKDRKHQESFIVGFASLPMEETQFIDRGMSLFQDVVKQMPEITFIILWRNELLNVPQELKEAKNCQIIFGKYNMEKFYNEIDCVIIPYVTKDNNHACSLSGIEAMMNNIPVISTNVAGISDIIQKSKLGIVCEPKVDDVVAAIYELNHNIENYIGEDKVEKIHNLFSSKHAIAIIEETLEDYFPSNFITLEEWDFHLKNNNKYLVKGHDSIKNYYQNLEVAKNYNENRFILYPGNYFDSFERISINIVIKNYFNCNNLEILDIASGDGRIVQEDIKFGRCTAADSSKAMLDIVENRFSASGNIKTVICDYFMDTIDKSYDVITTFRYIRHYDYVQRKLLYKRIYNNLKTGGMLIFDAPNIKYTMNTRNTGNWGEFNIYDVFWDEKSIIQELEENNFEVKYLIPIGVKSIDNDPVSWTVAAIKK